MFKVFKNFSLMDLGFFWTYIYFLNVFTNQIKCKENLLYVTSVLKIFSKMWELYTHPGYDQFNPLTSK